jgi:peptide/nickel transport system substrate-binding protein
MYGSRRAAAGRTDDPVTRPSYRGCASALVVTAVMAGCGQGPAADRGAREPAAWLPAFDINPVPREELRTGGTLRWPLARFPLQWNLMRADAVRGAADDVLQGLLPYVMRCDEKAVPHPDPDYLTDVRVSGRAGRQVVTYTLNPRARWSDGTPITYRDYVAQARRLRGGDERFRVGAIAGYDHIAEAERGANDHQVVVTFARPLADWPSLFGPLYPAATSERPEVFDRGWSGRIGVTAGPFAVQSLDGTAETITLARNPRWWGRPAKLDRIVYRAMDRAAMAPAFAAGRIDLMDVGLDAAIRPGSAVRGAVIRAAGAPDARSLAFNASLAPLSDDGVRQAIASGIDRTAVAVAGFGDPGHRSPALGNHVYLNTQEGYQDNAPESGTYDPDEAMRLLDRAGWVRRGDHRVKDGKILELRFAVPPAGPAGPAETRLIREMLRRIGVRTVLETVPAYDPYRPYLPGHPGGGSAARRDFDLATFSAPGSPFPLSSPRQVFTGPGVHRTGSAGVDRALDRALAEPDPGRVRELANDADRLMWRRMTVLPLYQRPQLVAIRPYVANAGARGFYDLVYEDIGFTP